MGERFDAHWFGQCHRLAFVLEHEDDSGIESSVGRAASAGQGEGSQTRKALTYRFHFRSSPRKAVGQEISETCIVSPDFGAGGAAAK